MCARCLTFYVAVLPIYAEKEYIRVMFIRTHVGASRTLMYILCGDVKRNDGNFYLSYFYSFVFANKWLRTGRLAQRSRQIMIANLEYCELTIPVWPLPGFPFFRFFFYGLAPKTSQYVTLNHVLELPGVLFQIAHKKKKVRNPLN